MEAEVPPASATNQRRRSQKIWGGAEVRQSAGMAPENRQSPANKREAWQTWQSKSHHFSSRIVESPSAQQFFFCVMTLARELSQTVANRIGS